MDSGFDDLRLIGRYKDLHKRTGKDTDEKTDSQTEEKGNKECASDPLSDAVFFFCSEILCNKSGEGISEILYRHIGEGMIVSIVFRKIKT